MTWFFVFALLHLPLEWPCDACGLEFKEGVRAGDYTLHKACYDKAPKCFACQGVVLKRAVKEGDHVLHDHCHRNAVRCRICEQGIHSGRYIKADQQTFHSTCYNRAAKCKLCRGPLLQERGAYHLACRATADKCYLCTEPLVGTYYTDLYERMICRNHPGPRCNICQSPELAYALDDGRHLCKRCDKTAIFPQDDIIALAEDVRKTLNQMGLKIDREIFVELVDQREMRRLNGSGSQQVGRFKREIKGETERWTISVLYGLPKSYFKAVIAHELAHAWQASHCIADQDEELVEGVAELISYLYLNESGQDFWTKTITDKNVEPYHSGFIKAQRLYQHLGAKAFFDQVRHWQRF